MEDENGIKELTKANIKDVLSNKENKFIYFYKSSSFNPEEY
jgi:hypothetical protein